MTYKWRLLGRREAEDHDLIEHENKAKKQCLMRGLHPMSRVRQLQFPVVRLRGLPFDCTENDILEFFLGFDVVDVLLMHKKGRLSGEGFVVFGTPGQVTYALQRHRHRIRHRYIEIFVCGKRDYYHAIAAEVGRPCADVFPLVSERSQAGVLKLRGLPFSVSKRDIINFFKEFKLKENAVHLVLSADGRTTGEAFVEFASSAHSKAALDKDKMILGDRYVELFPVSCADPETTSFHKSII